MKSPETKKAPKPRKGAPETAKKAPKSAPVAKRQKETKAKVDETLLPMKTGLKFVVSKYIRTLDIPAEKLEETIRLTLENLSEQADANGRKLDSLYWFREGCSVEIKNGKILAKDTEEKTIISGLKIKVVKPKKTAKKAEDTVDLEFIYGAEVGVEGSGIELAVGGVTPEEASDGAIPDGEAIPSQEEELSDDDVTPIEDVEAEAPASPVETAPAVATAEIAEQSPVQLEQESTPLTPELIALIASTNVEFQKLRVAFDSLKSAGLAETGVVITNLGQIIKLTDTLTKLTDPQFKLPEIRLLRMRLANLRVEVEQYTATTTVQQPDKKVVEMPSLITGLETKVKTFSENIATWISEVDLITNTSRIPTEKEVQGALDKNAQLLAESNGLRKTISDIETSKTFDGKLQPQISALKEQIAKASLDMEAPVKKLQAFLTNHKKPLSAPPPPPSPAARPYVVRTVTTRDRGLPVNVDDVFKGNSRSNGVLAWLKDRLKDLTK